MTRLVPSASAAQIGILTGSGPDAGIDLWSKVLASTRRRLGERFEGDRSAPSVLVWSDPRLGSSMWLPRTRVEVGRAMREGASFLDPCCGCWTVACNTLHVFEPELRAIGVAEHFVSFVGVAGAHLRSIGARRVVVLGSETVSAPGPGSPYHALTDEFDLVALDEGRTADMHGLIHDVKRLGPDGHGLTQRLAALVDVPADAVLLACTELPLIAGDAGSERVVDVTALVADELVSRAGVLGSGAPL